MNGAWHDSIKIKMRLIVFLSFILAFCASSIAQVSSFSGDSEKFLEDVEKHLGSYDKKYAKEFVEKFTPVWMSMSSSDKAGTVKIANKFVAKGFRVFPDFEAFIVQTHDAQANGKQKYLGPWYDMLDKTLEVKQRSKVGDFMNSTRDIFSTGSVFKSTKIEWQVQGDLTFEFKKAPIIKFSNAKLFGIAYGDTSLVDGCSGIVEIFVNKLNGEGGKMYWTRAGLPKNETYAELGAFKIGLKSTSFYSEKSTLNTPLYPEPLTGKVHENIKKLGSNSEVKYPFFESYSQKLSIPNIVPGVNYEGGFNLKGSVFEGAGTSEEPAKLTFLRNEAPFVEAKAKNFDIKKDKIACNNAAIKFFIEKDSITHPGLNVDYKLEGKRLTLSRVKEGVGQAPFRNSYHKLEMYADAIYWNEGDTTISIAPQKQSSNIQANFESYDYFDLKRFDGLGKGGGHPLVAISSYAVRYDVFEFPAKDIATYLQMPTKSLVPTLINLNNLGYLDYDIDKEYVVLNQKTFDHVKARSGRHDFDYINIDSEVSNGNNATLNLKTLTLEINGVKKTSLSERQFVRIYPNVDDMVNKSGSIKVFKNRDMSFDGIILAGNTEFFGKSFYFDYDKFNISLPLVDSTRIRVIPFDMSVRRQVRLISKIQGISGDIKIDDPSNKSGLDTSFNQYPILNSLKESYIYYDEVYPVYTKKDFKFVIKPFQLDSLDNFLKQTLFFEGTLISAGIFPDIEEKLVVMPDYSLGFKRQMPEGGLDLYGDRGKFDNTLSLTGQGLQGDGTINYRTSTSVSEAFTFFPDSTSGIAQFDNKGQGKPYEVPNVKGEGVNVTYVPESDILYARSVGKKRLEFMDGESTLKGGLALTENGMTGRGRMLIKDAQLLARKFTYRERKILSDTAEFILAALDVQEDEGQIGLETNNVSASVDFDERIGNFKSNNENEPLLFPENQYICFMDEIKWFMDDDGLEFQKKTALEVESTEFEKPNFYSIHPKQDSLSFMAPKARFDRRTKKISCTEVPFMDIADARIVPDSGRVVIQKKAKIETLKNAQIVANNITKNHLIVNATVEVNAKRDYKAEGDYFYIDEDKSEFKIHFANIEPDSTYTTFAKGEIKPEENFRLSKYFEFAGNVELYAINKSLVFDGATRIAHECNGIEKNYMNFRSQIDPLNILIPVGDDLKNRDGDPIGAGVIMDQTEIEPYITFLSKKHSGTDLPVIQANGLLYYDKDSKEYRISNEEKLKERSLPGNYVSLDIANCNMMGDGKYYFGTRTGLFDMTGIGVVNFNSNSGELTTKGALILDFPILDNSLEKMADKMKENTNLLPLELGKTFYKKSLMEILDRETAEKIESDITLKGEIKGKMPDEVKKSLYIADVRFKWNAEKQVYISEGLIGIATVGKHQVFKYVNGKIVVQKRITGSKGDSKDKVYVYLDLDPTQWFYFEYTAGKEDNLSVVAKDEEFNNEIMETKEDKLKYKGGKGVSDLVIQLAAGSKRSRFLAEFSE